MRGWTRALARLAEQLDASRAEWLVEWWRPREQFESGWDNASGREDGELDRGSA